MRRTIARLLRTIARVLLTIFEIGITLVSLLPLAKEPIRREVNASLVDAFRGRLTIDAIDELDFHGVRGGRVTITDPDGVVVVTAYGVDADVSLVDLGVALVRGQPLVIDRAKIAYGDVSLDQGPDGAVRIARTFEPKTHSGGQSKVQLRIDRIELDHAWVHGRFASQFVDAEADGLVAALSVKPGRVRLDAELMVRGRAMPRDLNPFGKVRASLIGDDSFHLRALFDGVAGSVAAHAGGGIDGDAAFVRLITDPSMLAPIPEPIMARGRAAGTFTGAWDLDVTTAMGRDRATVLGRWENSVLHAHARAVVEGNAGEADVDVSRESIEGNAGVEVRDLSTVMRRFDKTAWKGHGHAELSGRFELASSTLDAHAMLAIAALDRDGIRVGTFAADADAKGALGDPSIDLRLHAESIVVPKTRISAITIAAKGHASSADVSARIFAVEPIDVRAHAGVVRGGVTLDRVFIETKGDRLLEGSLRWQEGFGDATVIMPAVEISRVRAVLGSDANVSGRIAVAGRIRFSASSADGFVSADVAGVEWNQLHGLGGHVDVSAISGRWSIVGRAHTSSGWLAVDSVDVAPDGTPFSLAAWEHAKGTVHVATTADLSTLPWPDEVRATGSVHLTIDMTRSGATPSIEITAETTGLHAFVKDTEIDGDVSLLANVNGSGRLTADVEARSGTVKIARVHLVAPIPWAELVRGRIPTFADLEATPITELEASVPWGDAAFFCKLAGQKCSGQLGLALVGTGVLGSPHIKLSGVVADFRTPSSPIAGAVSASVEGSWDGANGLLAIDASSGKTGTLTTKVRLDATDRAHWFASIDSKLNDLPLRTPEEVVPEVKGRVSGTLTLDDWHRDARVHADLTLAKLEVDAVATEAAKVKASYDGKLLGLDATFEGENGNAVIHVASAAAWGAALLPKLDASKIELGVKAKAFRLKSISGLIPGHIGDLDGKLDADASASVSIADAHVTARGFAKIREGTFDSASLGELNDITADLAMHDDGILRLDDFRARSGAGWLHASGWARIPNGTLEEVKLEADIDRAHPFPLVMGGAHIGNVWGRVETSLEPSDRRLAVVIDLPTFHVLLPAASPHDLVDLDPAPNIRFGVRKDGKLVELALVPPAKKEQPRSGRPIVIDVVLGNDVQVEQGDTLRATLSGRPRVEIDHGVRVTGQVIVTRGTMDVSGKRFQIERATATFTGDPSNPMIFATASWDAPDGSKIHADYVGTVAKGKVTLRSEPAHTHDEIIALLVFGTISGPSGGGPASDTTSTAVGAGASLAAQPLNKALRQLTMLDIRTRVDTSSTNPKTEVEVELARDIAASIAYVIGVPPPGTNPDRYWLTIAWRVSARWTADATVGDQGSSIFELTWHFRY